jgi:hypothetical protein
LLPVVFGALLLLPVVLVVFGAQDHPLFLLLLLMIREPFLVIFQQPPALFVKMSSVPIVVVCVIGPRVSNRHELALTVSVLVLEIR